MHWATMRNFQKPLVFKTFWYLGVSIPFWVCRFLWLINAVKHSWNCETCFLKPFLLPSWVFKFKHIYNHQSNSILPHLKASEFSHNQHPPQSTPSHNQHLLVVYKCTKPQHPFTCSLNKETRVFLWRFSALQSSSEDSLNFERASLKIQTIPKNKKFKFKLI